ncbi:hypothetical protein [uncultured Roseovarius sp.]|nr:hypothetical protein [uncultured Roseovarius sp.]
MRAPHRPVADAGVFTEALASRDPEIELIAAAPAMPDLTSSYSVSTFR